MKRHSHRRRRWRERGGYSLAVLVSAVGHVALFALILFVPAWVLEPGASEPPAYTVRIVDSLPAGGLGTHLPALAPSRAKSAASPSHPSVTPIPALRPKKTAKVVEKVKVRPVSRKPPPPPAPSVAPQPKTRPAALVEPPPAAPTASAEPTPTVPQRLAKLRRKLLSDFLTRSVKSTGEPVGSAGPESGAAKRTNAVPAIGPGSGSVGLMRDLDFLLYYGTVQERIKQAWRFTGASGDLTTSVSFAITSDGEVSRLRITRGSENEAFDDSVLRAIRHASPFPPPPEKYRSEFAAGIEALFKLGELSS